MEKVWAASPYEGWEEASVADYAEDSLVVYFDAEPNVNFSSFEILLSFSLGPRSSEEIRVFALVRRRSCKYPRYHWFT